MNRENIVNFLAAKEHLSPINLVTGDGSVNCQANPNDQESTVAPLHFCEAVFALCALAPGGSLVLKMFTLYEIQSQALLYILGCAFEELSVTKPACSKSGNAETYIVGKNYTPLPSEYLERLLSYIGPDFPKDSNSQTELSLVSTEVMSVGFQAEMVCCAGLFTKYFTDVIQRNLALDISKTREDDQIIRNCHREVAKTFIEKYRVRAISREKWIVRDIDINGSRLNSGILVSKEHGIQSRKIGSGAGPTLAERQEAW